MRPTEYLIHEHRAIKVVLSVMDKIAANIRDDKGIDNNDFTSILEFLEVFADKCHLIKEEKAIYPVLVEAGISGEDGLLNMVLQEHATGREHIRKMGTAIARYNEGNEEALEVMTDSISKYIDLTRKHIEKEENALFPMVEKFLPAMDRNEIFLRFQKIEEDIVGPGVHDKFHDLLKSLRNKYLN